LSLQHRLPRLIGKAQRFYIIFILAVRYRKRGIGIMAARGIRTVGVPQQNGTIQRIGVIAVRNRLPVVARGVGLIAHACHPRLQHPLQRAVIKHLLTVRLAIRRHQVLAGIVIKSRLVGADGIGPVASHIIGAFAGIGQVTRGLLPQVIINHRLYQVVLQRTGLHGNGLQLAPETVII